MKEVLLGQNVIENLTNFYGIETDKLTLVLGGADVDATAYKAESGNSSYFVKIKRGISNSVIPRVLDLLSKAGIQQVIQPIKTNQNHTVQQLIDSSMMVFPFIPGKNGFDCELTHSQWMNLGNILKQVHSVEILPEVRRWIRQEEYSPQRRNAIRSFYSQLEEVTPRETSLEMIQFLRDHKKTIFKLCDQAERLSQEVQNLAPPFVLCHSDIHAGNVLIGKTGEIHIVDWDSPILAPKERDLMFIGGGVAGVWNQLFEEELFYQGYGPTEVDRTILAYYRHERIVEDIVEYIQALVFTTLKTPEEELRYKQFTDMFEANNVVEIAFKTTIVASG